MGIGQIIGIKSKTTDEQEQTQNTIKQEAFTEDQLMAAWYTFKEDIPEYKRIHHIFTKVPALEGNIITVEVKGSLIEQDLLKIKSKLLAHLRSSLKNDLIEININVSEDTTLTATPKEKLKLYIEENSALKDFIATFHLTLE